MVSDVLVQQDRKADCGPEHALRRMVLPLPKVMGGIRMYSPGDSYSGPVWIKDSGQVYIEFDPFEMPKLASGGNPSPPGDLRIAVLEHAGFHDGEQVSTSLGLVLITEVIGAIVKTLEDIGAEYTVYRELAYVMEHDRVP